MLGSFFYFLSFYWVFHLHLKKALLRLQFKAMPCRQAAGSCSKDVPMNRVTVSQTARGARTHPPQALSCTTPIILWVWQTQGAIVTGRVRLPLWGVCGQDQYLRERGCVTLGQESAIVGANLAAPRWVAVVFQGGERWPCWQPRKIQGEMKLFLEGLAVREESEFSWWKWGDGRETKHPGAGMV